MFIILETVYVQLGFLYTIVIGLFLPEENNGDYTVKKHSVPFNVENIWSIHFPSPRNKTRFHMKIMFLIKIIYWKVSFKRWKLNIQWKTHFSLKLVKSFIKGTCDVISFNPFLKQLSYQIHDDTLKSFIWVDSKTSPFSYIIRKLTLIYPSMFLMLNLQVNIDVVKPPQKRINLTKPKKEYFRQICWKKGVNRTCALPIGVTYNQVVTPINEQFKKRQFSTKLI